MKNLHLPRTVTPVLVSEVAPYLCLKPAMPEDDTS